jgi:predicted O-methyltransferase YrrM
MNTRKISWWNRNPLSVMFRSAGDKAVGLVPRPALRAFLKSFTTRPELAESAGFLVLPRRFDSPVPVPEDIDLPKLEQPRSLPGIDLRISSALQLVSKLGQFVPELDSIPYEPDGKSLYWFNNLSFTDFDATVLYALLRFLKPKRYVELGCGYSSLVSSRALRQNQQEGTACDAAFCDPEPRLDIARALESGRLIEKRVQDLPLELFTKLEAGDVLFIDTSHVLKLQSDVEHELLRILPSLAAGVWIHIHDVFTPYDYPRDWVMRPVRLACNEQYALECLLTGGERYQTEIPLHCLVRENLPAMQIFFPRGRDRAQSFWLRKTAGRAPGAA